MKRILFALGVGVILTIIVAFAANLVLDGGVIQVGSDNTLTCDTDGVQVAGWGLETDDSTVRFVRIGGISSNCLGDDLFVKVYDTTPSVIAEGSKTIASAEEKIDFSAPYPSAAAIDRLTVWIEGP